MESVNSKERQGDYRDDVFANLNNRRVNKAAALKGNSVLRDSISKHRNESFQNLMGFSLDKEFAKAERNLSMVNATQQFVNKAMRGTVVNKRVKKSQLDSFVDSNVVQGDVEEVAPLPEGLKTSIKQANNVTVFKGINIV